MKKSITTSLAPAAIGPYSQAIIHGDTLYCSGQIPLDPQTMLIVGDDIHAQTLQVFDNLEAVCQAAGGQLNDIVKLTIYLIDLAHFPIVNELMAKRFEAPYPARCTVQVVALPKAALIEIDAMMRLSRS